MTSSKDQSSKVRGDIATLLFAAEAKKHGFIVLNETGDNAPFDAVLYHPNGKFTKVQIKSTLCAGSRGTHEFVVKRGSTSLAYSEADVDMFACYAFDLDQWWLIPVKDVRGRKKIFFDGRDEHTMYINNWDFQHG
jgi:hypothetical protein